MGGWSNRLKLKFAPLEKARSELRWLFPDAVTRFALPFFQYSVTPPAVTLFAGEASDLAEQIITIVGLCIAFYGRARAVVPGFLAKKP